MSVEKVAQLLRRRPAAGRLQEQLFWLVDLIYTCKTSGHDEIAAQAPVVEEALSSLGEYLETGDTVCLRRAGARIEQLAKQVKTAVAAARGDEKK